MTINCYLRWRLYFDLEDNKHLPVEAAIQQAFGMSSAQLDRALREYVATGHYRYYPIPTPPGISSNNYTAVPLSAADSNAVLADIHLHSHDYQERALSEFQDILKSDPKNAAACRGLGYAYLQKQDFTQAAEYFSQASQLDSKDPRVHYYNALLMSRARRFRPTSPAARDDQGTGDLHKPRSKFCRFLCAVSVRAIRSWRSGKGSGHDA